MTTTRSKKVVVFLTALCLGLTVSSVAFSQEQAGAINGVVSDESGAVLPGVSVTVIHKTTNRVITIVTGSDGQYHARPLGPGRYSVKFELPGFAPTEFPDVNLLLGQTLKVDAQMKVGGLQQTAARG